MQTLKIVDYSQINNTSLKCLISGENFIIVIRNFYNKKNCQDITDRIKKYNCDSFQNGKLRHIGPFLMAHTTSKKKYFKDAAKSQKTFKKIFCGMDSPILRVYDTVSRMLPGYSVSPAHEDNNYYSQAIIRIHEKGTAIPLHKDNVTYEGKDYLLSNIDHQLSCVLHIQESEGGGRLLLYDRKWKKDDECFRNIDFGYSLDLIGDSSAYMAPSINTGDLVIINPFYYHLVTRITGDTPRITLGMFMGLYVQDRKIVAWA
ncbi:MAG: hypothetical protein F4W68_02170 [Cenarchaeum sp. SB0661_bin_35]|nr:hypothetical protein [Cenarchaeum sp. SB0662_bin_33]MYC79296.1 hypothetical protein [Cenarchaeum sp. SB0661_bin_35]MYD59063.1 hypothetical protein [Cenarchaeum sp. SB0678_bin_8]MYG32851.1 hypothetical protein [Cenarchaeum sp. SB0677_bin_16]